MDRRTLVDHIYTADPSARVVDGRIYVYCSHDVESGIPEGDDGEHFAMRDYHVLSMDSVDGEVTDHGVALDVDDVPWASRQMWAPDAARKDGKTYFYFPAKDANDQFRIGVAVGDSPAGPFEAQPYPIRGSYSIDPCVFEDAGTHYLAFGGLWGGQLQRYRDNKAIECGHEPADDEPALYAKIARLTDDLLEFAEPPRDIPVLDEAGKPIRAGDHDRRFFEGPWLHKHGGVYYFSYSTGNTHKICYATGDSACGPFTYRGVLLTPVVGWTTQHSVIEVGGKSYLFYHDSQRSGGKTWLRSVKVTPLHYDADGSIRTLAGG